LPGADHGKSAERESKWASGGGVPIGVQEQSTWWRVTGAKPPEKLFVVFIQKVAKS